MVFSGIATTTDAPTKAVSSKTAMMSEEHEKWIEARGLDLEIAIRYGLFTDRQSPDGRDLTIPYRRDGKTINHKYRGPGKRFRQDVGSPRSFWKRSTAVLVFAPNIPSAFPTT